LVRLPPPRGQNEIGDVLQHGGGVVVGGARRRQPAAGGGQLPCPAHLERVQQQHDAVGGGEVPDVLLHGLLRPQVLARRVEEREQRVLRPAPARPAPAHPAVQAEQAAAGGGE